MTAAPALREDQAQAVSVSFTVLGQPVAFARAGSNGTQRFTPPKQRAWKSDCGFMARCAMRGRAPMGGPVHLDVVAVFPIPMSWTRAERAGATWHTSTPDGDNVLKAVADALKAIVWIDDAQVALWSLKKLYGDQPRVIVTVTPLVAEQAA